MKLSVVQDNLARALGVLGRVVSTRSSLPVLGNVLLRTEKSRLLLSATNLEIGINYWIGAKVEHEGAVTVPARLLGEFMSHLPNDKVTLSAENNNLVIKSDNYSATINGISADEFPLIPQVKGEAALKLPVDTFKTALSRVVFAAALDEARPVLSGVYFNLDGTKLALAATDSYRLSECVLELKTSTKAALNIIVPARTINELIRILADSSDEVSLHLSENQAMFVCGDVQLVSRLIEGQFPNYKQIIPETSQTKVVVNHEELTGVVKIASLFARENANSLKVEVKPDEGISISSSSSQIGENKSLVPAKIDGPAADISLNSRYLLDVLGIIKSQEIELSLSGKLNPCLIRSRDKGDNFLHLIMPLRS